MYIERPTRSTVWASYENIRGFKRSLKDVPIEHNNSRATASQ